MAVSYTHLRAHETVLDLVCRLLLEKKIIHEDEKVVLFNCASGLKYPMPDSNQTIDKNSVIEYSQFA